MLFSCFLTICIILNFESNKYVIAPKPEQSSTPSISTLSSTRSSTSYSSNLGKKTGVGSKTESSSIASSSSRSSSLRSSSTISSISPTFVVNSIVLDFGAEQISNDLELATNIPGILKYSAKQSSSGTFNALKGNGKELKFSKKIDHVFCNSPFDGNVTVVFDDQTSEEFILGADGFAKAHDQDADAQPAQESPVKTLQNVELDLENPPIDFTIQQIGNIKCFKPGFDQIISRIKIEDSERTLETDISENFVCSLKENKNYSLLVCSRNNENEWQKYTLSKLSSKPILMDVTLIRKFDQIDVETIFADTTNPDDEKVFVFDNLKVNETKTGVLKSKVKGNKVFVLEMTDTSNNTDKVEIEFLNNFLVQEGFKLHSITTLPDYSEMFLTHRNDNVLIYEKYVNKEGKYEKDLCASHQFNLERTKSLLDKNDTNQSVLFLKTLVPDSVDQGIKISHHGNFKVLDFQPGEPSTYVVLPNLEFYLDKDLTHKLIVSENGGNINMVMNTETNNKRTHYFISNDPVRGNPFSIKSMVEL